MFAGQLTAGGVVSTTVKVVTQLLLLLAASVAVTVIVCGPSPTRVPAAGFWLSETALQLSAAVTPPVTSGIAAWQCASADAVVGAGQLTAGGVVSTTVKVVTQLLLLAAASVAVTVIVCGPSPTRVPAAGFWLSETALQLSAA